MKAKFPNVKPDAEGLHAAFLDKHAARADTELAAALLGDGYTFPNRRDASSTRNPLRDRRFIGWDGEGYTEDRTHHYCLFGCSIEQWVTGKSLSTTECFELLLSVERQYPDAVHICFGMGYDVNMMLESLNRGELWRLYRFGAVRWNGYRIEYRPSKWLQLSRNKVAVKVYDVFGFFQSSFVKACEQFLGSDDPELQRIREGKQARSTFRYEELHAFILPYWQGELRLLVRLMESLRDDLTTAGLQPRSWHGPGAVANEVFRQRNTKQAMCESPLEVRNAAQYAYAGGRFELFRCGHHPNTVWEYDINSAYPAAIAGLPNLNRGAWKHARTFQPDSFGVWRISFDPRINPRTEFVGPQPLFHRNKHGSVSFPSLTAGWYWTPEASLVDKRYIKEGWVFEHDGSLPFGFVPEMYATRQQWKREGNSAERALKLALNSLYGKMAQRVGYTQDRKIPKWHQLEWAGYVTSYTRAMIYRAIRKAAGAVIAVETDAVFSTQPLPLPLGDGLGEWEETRFDWITYIQSGLYYAGTPDGIIERYRGFDHGSLPYDKVMESLRHRSSLVGSTTRFIGLGLALSTHARWRTWSTGERAVTLGGGGKRSHVPPMCDACRERIGLHEGLHPMVILSAGGTSHPHSLPWVGEQPVWRVEEELARW